MKKSKSVILPCLISYPIMWIVFAYFNFAVFLTGLVLSIYFLVKWIKNRKAQVPMEAKTKNARITVLLVILYFLIRYLLNWFLKNNGMSQFDYYYLWYWILAIFLFSSFLVFRKTIGSKFKIFLLIFCLIIAILGVIVTVGVHNKIQEERNQPQDNYGSGSSKLPYLSTFGCGSSLY